MALRFLRFVCLVQVVLLAACSSGGTRAFAPFPSQSTSGSVSQLQAASARRALAPPAAPVSSIRKGTEGLTASSVVLRAIPIVLRAIPIVGSASAPSAAPPCTTVQTAGCQTLVRTDVTLGAASTPAEFLSGLLPGQLNQIYNLAPMDTVTGKGHTVAAVVAFDDPAAEADLAVYRSTFGLPPCTTANGCFKKIDEHGSSNYPAADTGWSLEAITDIETISAVCPACNITLVEASTSNIPDLATAVDTAAAAGASVISNSYGVPEASDNTQYESHYNHPGVAIVASAGDNGYGALFPASSPNVIAVGGTSLYSAPAGISEAVWPHTGSGCSAFFAKPKWQDDTGCTKRTLNDVAVVADPSTGMAIYDSILDGTKGGWTVVGGTSIGSPIISSLIALGKHPEHYTNAERLYGKHNADSLFAITYGSNGICSISYLCDASASSASGPEHGSAADGQYNGPTGVGSPDGNSAFNG